MNFETPGWRRDSFRSDYVGKKAGGEKEYKGDRPNEKALEKKRKEYVLKAADEVIVNRKNKEIVELLKNITYSRETREYSNETESILSRIAYDVVDELKKEHGISEKSDKNTTQEFGDTYPKIEIEEILKKNLKN